MIIEPKSQIPDAATTRLNQAVAHSVRRALAMDYITFLSGVSILTERYMENEATAAAASQAIVAVAAEPQTTLDARTAALNLHGAMGERAVDGLYLFTEDSLPGRLRADGRQLLAITFPFSGKNPQFDGQLNRLIAVYRLPLSAASPAALQPDPQPALASAKERMSALASRMGGTGFHKED